MAVRARFSIALLMAVVLLVAADFAIVRALWPSSENYEGIAIVTLPTINILLLAFPKLRRSGDSRPFWLGFVVIGWLVVSLVVLIGWSFDDALFAPVIWLDQIDPFVTGTVPEIVFLITFAVIFYTLPQLLAAALGGRLMARYRIVIERRR